MVLPNYDLVQAHREDLLREAENERLASKALARPGVSLADIVLAALGRRAANFNERSQPSEPETQTQPLRKTV